MKILTSARQLLTLGVLSMILAFTPQAQATSYTSLVVFGDSLSDSGNLSDLFLGFLGPDDEYADSRFTSDFTDGTPGLVWVEHLAGLMGLTLDNSVAGGTNYAFGGATASGMGATPPSISDQLGLYMSDLMMSGVGLDDTGLFVVWAGGNDVLSLLDGGPGASGAAGSIGSVITA
ncbi:MAG: hypothetical protein HKN70_08740, partial [Gammaproteobacteria bacterium]|nr:hypothetical protein [Gammaproteobacteria bacterium]